MKPDAIEKIYRRYIEALCGARSAGSFTDGLMGFGKSDDSYPCHDEFYDSLDAEITSLTAKMTPQEAAEALEYICFAPLDSKDDNSAYWMMIAAHSLAARLVPLADESAAAELAGRYEAAYPRHERLPVQNELLKQLKKRARPAK